MAVTRIGEILKARGLLNEEQIQQILGPPAEEDRRVVFGSIASEQYAIEEAELWRAWALQIIEYCPRMNPSTLTIPDEGGTEVPHGPRGCGPCRMLPVDLTDNEIVICTTAETASPNAMAIAQIRSAVPAVLPSPSADGDWRRPSARSTRHPRGNVDHPRGGVGRSGLVRQFGVVRDRPGRRRCPPAASTSFSSLAARSPSTAMVVQGM